MDTLALLKTVSLSWQRMRSLGILRWAQVVADLICAGGAVGRTSRIIMIGQRRPFLSWDYPPKFKFVDTSNVKRVP